MYRCCDRGLKEKGLWLTLGGSDDSRKSQAFGLLSSGLSRDTVPSLGLVLAYLTSPATVSGAWGSVGALGSLLSFPWTSAGWAVALGASGRSSSSPQTLQH